MCAAGDRAGQPPPWPPATLGHAWKAEIGSRWGGSAPRGVWGRVGPRCSRSPAPASLPPGLSQPLRRPGLHPSDKSRRASRTLGRQVTVWARGAAGHATLPLWSHLRSPLHATPAHAGRRCASRATGQHRACQPARRIGKGPGQRVLAVPALGASSLCRRQVRATGFSQGQEQSCLSRPPASPEALDAGLCWAPA